MNVLLETAFHRLLSKYEQTFGDAPPFTAATADEVVDYMRRRLREAERGEGFYLRGGAAAVQQPAPN